jgi:plasmid maintenance system antidote protein VapI
MQSAFSLIDKALEVCGGSQSELARRIGVTRQLISALQKRKQPVTTEIAGLLAEVIGEDVAAAVLVAALDQMSDTPRGQHGREAVQRAFLAGAVAIFGTSATTSSSPTSQMQSQGSQRPIDKIYIV